MRHIARYIFTVLLTSSLAWASTTAASEKLFVDNCAVCHQKDGAGIPNVYPSLVTSEVVRASAADMALVLLIGRGEMPGFKGYLSSEDMASIINYVRSTFAGVDNEPITAAHIDALQ